MFDTATSASGLHDDTSVTSFRSAFIVVDMSVVNETENNRAGDTSSPPAVSVTGNYVSRAASTGNIMAAILLATVAIVGFVLNMFVVIAILSNRLLRRRVADILCCHLAFVGLLWCVSVLPLSVTSAVTSAMGSWSSLSDGSFCTVHGFFRSAVTHAGVWTIAALGFDKYRTIMAPLHHVAEADFRRIGTALSAIWIGSFLLAAPPLVASTVVGTYGFIGSVSACGYHSPYLTIRDSRSPAFAIAYTTVVLAVGFLFPFGVVAHCYFRMYHVARWHRRRIAAMTAVVNVITLSVGVPMVARGLQQQNQQPTAALGGQQQQPLIDTGNRNTPTACDRTLTEVDAGGDGGSVRRRWRSTSSTRALVTVVGSSLILYAPHYVIQVICVCVEFTSFVATSGASGLTSLSAAVTVADFLLLVTPLFNALVYGVRNRALVKSFRSAVRSSALKDGWSRAATTVMATRV